MPKTGQIRIGISGWRYTPWRGVFYPPKLPQRQELEYASSKLTSLEINGTFYSLQRPTSFQSWYAATPPDFRFSVKGPRYITHIQRLRDVEAPVANFLASGVLLLADKLGPFLWQFPPSFKYDPELMENFLRMLPHDTGAAKYQASNHDKWMSKRASFEEVDPNRKLRHAIEIRNKSFAIPEFVELLRKHDVAIVCADTVEWPRITDVTSEFMYCRLHGSEVLYASGYDAKSLDQWAEWVLLWASGGLPPVESITKKPAAQGKPRDVFVYFDNDAKVRAPFDAQELIKRVTPHAVST
ncbi:MAG TPA: DUF72 domain-containing protein [Candidatus Eremiobacteraceae bacterium]|nr:DUF72 domain-containing protein [Candidatus Eremiobacteraceae bacterium]